MFDEGTAMAVTLKRVNGVWQVGRLDGSICTYATFADALEAAAIEFQDAWLESTGWFAGEVDHVAVA